MISEADKDKLYRHGVAIASGRGPILQFRILHKSIAGRVASIVVFSVLTALFVAERCSG